MLLRKGPQRAGWTVHEGNEEGWHFRHQKHRPNQGAPETHGAENSSIRAENNFLGYRPMNILTARAHFAVTGRSNGTAGRWAHPLAVQTSSAIWVRLDFVIQFLRFGFIFIWVLQPHLMWLLSLMTHENCQPGEHQCPSFFSFQRREWDSTMVCLYGLRKSSFHFKMYTNDILI